MGMFEKDKAMGLRLDELVPQGEEFTLWEARVLDDPVQTRFGLSENAELTITRKGGGERMKVTTLASAIIAKVKDQEEGDLPAVVCWLRVNTQAQENVMVLRFLRPLRGGGEGGPAHTPDPEATHP